MILNLNERDLDRLDSLAKAFGQEREEFAVRLIQHALRKYEIAKQQAEDGRGGFVPWRNVRRDKTK